MKNQYALHALWLAAAVGAYALGAWNRGSAPHPSPAGATVSRVTGPPDVSLRRAGGLAAGDDAEAGALTSAPGGARAALSVADIQLAAREAFNDPNPLTRQLAFAKLLEGLTPENAESIRDQMRTGRASGDQWNLFQYAWGAADGEGALAAAAKLENEDQRNRALSQTLSGWASADPNQAIAWVGQIENADEKNRLMGNLVGGLADHDIGLATRYVMGLADSGDPRAANHMATVAGEQLRIEGDEGAARWAETLPAGDLKGSALERVGSSYVARDPEAAATWAAQFANVDYGVRVIDEVGDEWAERDPVAAVAWLNSLADGRGKSAGMESALGEWARRDPTAASQYLIDMPTSPLKDQAVNGFVRRVAWEEPEAALAWARTIAQESTRHEAMTRAAQGWFVRDREAALQWLPTSGLSPEAQKRVLETRDRRRRG